MRKKYGVFLFFVVVSLVVTGCGGGSTIADDPNLGVWRATSAVISGMELPTENLFEEGAELELKPKGKCTLSVNGDYANAKWAVEDGVFTLTARGVNERGKIEGSRLTMINMRGSGVDLIFEKNET